jgi:hypothetical protein
MAVDAEQVIVFCVLVFVIFAVYDLQRGEG